MKATGGFKAGFHLLSTYYYLLSPTTCQTLCKAIDNYEKNVSSLLSLSSQSGVEDI